MALESFNEIQFRSKVDRALDRVRSLLDHSKNPSLQYASEVPHSYDDKYLLVDSVTNCAIAAHLVTLEQMGLQADHLAQMIEWSATRSVSLQFQSNERCSFVRKAIREIESETKSVSISSLFGKSAQYTVTKVTEWFWNFEVSYQLTAYTGSDPSKSVVLQKRTGSIELKTAIESAPKPAASTRSFCVNITWLVAHVDKTGAGTFRIDRAAASCRTPRRNSDVQATHEQLQQLCTFAQQVHRYIIAEVFPTQSGHGLDLKALHNDSALFVPVLPLFEQAGTSNRTAAGIPQWLTSAYLEEQRRALVEKQKELAATFPSNNKLVTVAEARLVSALQHMRATCQMWADAVDFVELMLRRQIVTAIGKEVSQVDLAQFLRFHYRKLFRPHVQPRPFCYAIRRAGHDPEGTLSLEAQLRGDVSLSDPVLTMVSEVSSGSSSARPMRFAIDAATEVRFGGERYVHGWVSHQFSGQPFAALQLVARARQFSSYVVLVGSIAAADLFVPKYAMLVQNKDELRLPLLLDTIPTPKAFRDAIESLSPEQQRFAKAFRAMQLESTLFGICVLQIKPALERLLNLPPDSLMKELQLTQDLLQLFIDYHIPSDLLSFDGNMASSVAQKLTAVHENVNRVRAIIDTERNAQLELNENVSRVRAIIDRDQNAQRELDELILMVQDIERKAQETSLLLAEQGEQQAQRTRQVQLGSRELGERSAELSVKQTVLNSIDRLLNRGERLDAIALPGGERCGNAAAPRATSKPPTSNNTSPPTERNVKGPSLPQPQPGVISAMSDNSSGVVDFDFTRIPQQLEQKYDQLDTDAALRPTIIKPGDVWTRKSKKSLLSEPETTSLDARSQGQERQKCFDLLDALTKSGALQLEHAALHVVIAATHCFDKSVMNTLVQDNVNPVEKLERSALILASTVHRDSVARLVAPDQVQRVATYSPQLITQEEIHQQTDT